jgi:hypothetical protein
LYLSLLLKHDDLRFLVRPCSAIRATRVPVGSCCYKALNEVLKVVILRRLRNVTSG